MRYKSNHSLLHKPAVHLLLVLSFNHRWIVPTIPLQLSTFSTCGSRQNSLTTCTVEVLMFVSGGILDETAITTVSQIHFKIVSFSMKTELDKCVQTGNYPEFTSQLNYNNAKYFCLNPLA